MNVTINTNNLRGRVAPLYKVYPRQNGPQRAYVEMDDKGCVSADIDYDIGGAVPMRVAHNRTLRWDVSPYANGDSLADLLDSELVRGLLERVHNGHTVEWDGSNMVGRLDDDAKAAALELEQILSPYSGEYELAQVCDAYAYIADWSNLKELVDAGSVDECAKRQLESNDPDLVIVGDMEGGVASRAAKLIEYNLDRKKVDEATVRAAEILVEYDEHEFSGLLKACREAAEEE